MTALTDEERAPLTTLGTRQPLATYLRELWDRRHFAVALAQSDLRARHMSSVLGQLWHLLNPAMMIAVYYLVFGLVLDARRGVDNYISFLVTGVIVFRFTQSTILGCGKSLDTNSGLIRSIQFPRALVPIAELLGQLMALVPAMALVVGVMLVDGIVPTWRLVCLPVVILAAALFSLGVGMAVARASSTISDMQQVLPHFFRIMLYVSGVLFSVHATIDNQLVRNLFALNPFYCIITAARWSLIGTPAGERVLVSLVVWTVVALVAGFAWFRRAEHRYGA